MHELGTVPPQDRQLRPKKMAGGSSEQRHKIYSNITRDKTFPSKLTTCRDGPVNSTERRLEYKHMKPTQLQKNGRKEIQEGYSTDVVNAYMCVYLCQATDVQCECV